MKLYLLQIEVKILGGARRGGILKGILKGKGKIGRIGKLYRRDMNEWELLDKSLDEFGQAACNMSSGIDYLRRAIRKFGEDYKSDSDRD